MNVAEAFGIILKRYRKAAKLSQEQLALNSNLDRTYIGLLERAQRQPSLTTIFELCNTLNISPHLLIKEIEILLEKS